MRRVPRPKGDVSRRRARTPPDQGGAVEQVDETLSDLLGRPEAAADTPAQNRAGRLAQRRAI